jgi:hypothetical protein
MTSKLISELIDLPERVLKVDFVLNLSAGVNEPQKRDQQPRKTRIARKKTTE